jgi:hypothetical protein
MSWASVRATTRAGAALESSAPTVGASALIGQPVGRRHAARTLSAWLHPGCRVPGLRRGRVQQQGVVVKGHFIHPPWSHPG